MLIALDGTEYFCSGKIHCSQCSQRLRSSGRTEYYHAMLGATLVATRHSHVVPLEPELVASQDGAEKQDCESRAARRWLAAHASQYARRQPIYLGDDLFSNQPICEAVRAVDGHCLVRLQAGLPFADPAIPHRCRTAEAHRARQTRPAVVYPQLSLDRPGADTRWQGCHAGQLARSRDPQPGRPDHMP
jgi:hypothetical protein